MDKSKFFTERGAELREKVLSKSGRGVELTNAIIEHFERLHSLPEIFDKGIEEKILLEKLNNLKNPKQLNFEKGLVTFSPSSASRCERELFFKAMNEEQDEQPILPYQYRWLRNASAVHEAVQKDLLLAETHLKEPKFTVEKMQDGSVAWEHNLKDVKIFEHNGVKFQLFGMMDGILRYTNDHSRIGFEYKTKSTTISAVGNYKLKDAQDSHKEQAIAYSLLFGIDEFLFVYESLAKDGWTKGVEAKPDLRAFYFKPTQEQKLALLDKFARVAKMVYEKRLPSPELDKCLFCPFKSVCNRSV